jgi:hypothetical protein
MFIKQQNGQTRNFASSVMLSVPQIIFFTFILLAAFVRNVNSPIAKLNNGRAVKRLPKEP